MNFFGEIISVIDTMDNADEYAVYNFGGPHTKNIHSMSKPDNVNVVVNYIIEMVGTSGGTFCDVGGGCGVLAHAMLGKGFDAYCIDGSDYGIKNNIIYIPLSRYAVFDMRNDIRPYIKVPFDVVTCFEMLEHIPKDGIKKVMRNIKHISKTFICSVHHGGVESFNHYNIKPLVWWERMFSTIGEVEVIGLPDIQCFNESSFMKVRF